ncbi:MAG: YdiU family protein [Gammaproteobacteria bacterium]|nr:YdiU family protein [Gammaproteobacteria bacterium]MCW8911679.1 YdiU family protein [Gammaproteobacteria bacterium]MCW9006083.1 YdiU family protein [Gammaproteobacteria bacterium]MCW9056889.1 YdiU family protein [Gammaproteobacteria bacterium]
MKTLEQLQFLNAYSQLPEGFYSRLNTTPLSNQYLISFNQQAAELIELHPDEVMRDDFIDIISGKKQLPGYEPLAMCYSGHQFGHYVPRLGDGRAILLGQVKTDSGERWDLQLKGAGPTEYSRGSDGRAVLRSTIREYLCSEAMHGLGIPTTRALCMIGSDTEVYREQIEPGAMLLRMAPSHIRFGSFEYFYYTQQYDKLKQLADHVIELHYPECKDGSNSYLALLKQAIKSTAELIAKWQAVGFSHGVMNTDNMSIHGLTLDYGPYGFLDTYQPDFICNHSDHQGRYAFNRQPDIGAFNLSCLAQALLPLLHEVPETAAELAMAELKEYRYLYVNHYAELMRNKLGLFEQKKEDQGLSDHLLRVMQKNNVDYTILFRALSQKSSSIARDLFIDREAFDKWYDDYQLRLVSENSNDNERSERMKHTNPKYILRNYMAEIAIEKATKNQDYSEIDRLLSLLQKPFDEHPDYEVYAEHPPEWAQQISVSCSS